MARTDLVVFSEAYESKADGSHASMTQQCNGIIGVLEGRGRIFGEAVVHVFGEVHGAEDVAAVDRHDGGGTAEV